ncbi:MAG: KH domain-containing protein [Candidatus Liptonbacteria bacterium]|nr:KH domain-containing protein [Candidatus Liptonbacteria bacterium]
MTQSQGADQEFLEFLIKSLVDHPDEVKVLRKVDEMGVLLSLKVHPLDMGQVVGRQGSTAKAIRSLLRIVGIRHNARVNLKIEEPEGGTRERRERREMPAEPMGGGRDQ